MIKGKKMKKGTRIRRNFTKFLCLLVWWCILVSPAVGSKLTISFIIVSTNISIFYSCNKYYCTFAWGKLKTQNEKMSGEFQSSLVCVRLNVRHKVTTVDFKRWKTSDDYKPSLYPFNKCVTTKQIISCN